MPKSCGDPGSGRSCRASVRARIASGGPRSLPAAGANLIWAIDFVFDSCANGQQLKCLTIIDIRRHQLSGCSNVDFDS